MDQTGFFSNKLSLRGTPIEGTFPINARNFRVKSKRVKEPTELPPANF